MRPYMYIYTVLTGCASPESEKAPELSLRGFSVFIWSGGNLLSRTNAHYHRRKPVSRSCSGWEGVVPGCCGRQFGSGPDVIADHRFDASRYSEETKL